MNEADTLSMKSHAEFDEPLLDTAKRGTKVKLVGRATVDKTAAFDLEVSFKDGEVDHHYLDASTFLLIKRTWSGKDKDGRAMPMSMRFGNSKKVDGRMINHSVEWDAPDGKPSKSAISKIAFDKPVDAKLFAMPR